MWHENAVHVVAGGGEQALPALTGAVEVVVPSKDTREPARDGLAEGRVLAPGTGEWTNAVQVLAAKRLNDRDRVEQRDRWARTRTVTRLEPVRVLGAGAGDDSTPAGAVRPPVEGSTTGRRRGTWVDAPAVAGGPGPACTSLGAVSGAPSRVFVARLAGLAVFDPLGDQVGRVRDVVAVFRPGKTQPARSGSSSRCRGGAASSCPMTRVTSMDPEPGHHHGPGQHAPVRAAARPRRCCSPSCSTARSAWHGAASPGEEVTVEDVAIEQRRAAATGA